MFRSNKKRRTLGFTLVELAIVLGVAGIMFGGLWRLLSTSNQQTRDQAVANQQMQLIGAISNFLQSTDASAFWNNVGASNAKLLMAPAGCDANAPLLCSSYLPPGMSNTSVNPYGQQYYVYVLKDPSTGIPSTFSFLILTTGGDTIPDTSGGRIAAMVGGDGGFIYSSNVCGSPTNTYACGAFGGWSVQPGAAAPNGFAVPNGNLVVGHIASRTFYSPASSQVLSKWWLARTNVQNDPNHTYNTLDSTAPGTSIWLNGQAINFDNPTTTAATKATINMQGGKINVQAGTIDLTAGGGLTLGALGQITGSGGGGMNLTGPSASPLVNAMQTCTKTTTDLSDGCQFGASLSAVSVRDLLNAGALYAQSHLYAGSDMRLKKDIKPLSDPLADVLKLKPVSFTFKADGKQSMGVIAQDLEKVYPQLVTGNGDALKSVEYNGLVAPLIGAVQQLKKENDELRAQVNAQAERQLKLEQELKSTRSK